MNIDVDTFLDVLNNCPMARLTAEKTKHISVARGYAITGFVLSDPDGNYCLVESAKVRWLAPKEMARIMQPAKKPIEKVELLGLLNQWIERFKEVEAAYKAGRDLLGCGPDSQLMCALYGAFGDYTKMLACVIGDDDEWLEWYLWENGAGSKGLEAKAAHQERMVPIKTIEDLCDLILEGEMSDWRFFSREEMACKHCGKCEMSELFMARLDELRAAVGVPLVVNSGYRCPEHNAAVSSTGRNGPHTTGKAVDLRVCGELAHNVLCHATKMGFSGIGVSQKGPQGSRFIHLDDLDGPTRPWVWSY